MKMSTKKKLSKKISPMQRSLKMMREMGYVCGITEKYNMFIKIRQDLFRFIDFLAVGNGKIIAVQTTTGEHILERKAKVEENKNYPIWKKAGGQVEIHGWRQLKGKWECRIIKL